MPDNKSTFNLFGDLSDSEIERFLLDSSDTDLETLDILHDEPLERDNDLKMYDDVLIHDDLLIDDDAKTLNDAKNQDDSLVHDNSVAKNRLPTPPNAKRLKNVEERQNKEAQQTVAGDNKIDVDKTVATPIKSEFDSRIDTIEDSMQAFKAQLKTIAALSDNFHDTSSTMMQAIRDLENLGDDDFSITYEQAYQLRGCLLAARRAFNEVPNFYDLVEQAWEYDLYTSQMRCTQHNED